MATCSGLKDWSSPGGPPGQPGAVRTEPIPVATGGDNFDHSNAYVTAPLSVIATALLPSFFSMELNAASRDYINQDVELAARRLRWLQSHLSVLTEPTEYLKTLGTTTEATRFADFAKSQRAVDARPLLGAYLQRVNSLLGNLALGYDYYGQPQNFVTLLSESYYREALKEMLDLASAVETAYEAYDYQKGVQENTRSGLQKTKDKALKAANAKLDEKRALTEKQPKLISTIQSLEIERNDKWLVLMTANQAFKNAVYRRGPGCSFEKLVAVGACVSTLVASGGTAAGSYAGLAAALNDGVYDDGDKDKAGKPISDDFKGFQYRVSKVVTAGKDGKSFVNAATALNKELEPPRDESGKFVLPSDEAKILAGEADIEAQLKPYMDMAEARDYAKTLKEFTTVCITRNNAILELNTMLLDVRRLDGEMAQIRIEADQLQQLIASNANPFTHEAAAFMEHAWLDSIATLVRMLKRVHSAYRYYSLDDTSTLPIEDFSVASLKAAAGIIVDSYVRKRESVGSERSRIRQATIGVTKLVAQAGMTKFRRDGVVTFTLDPREPAFLNLCNVLVGDIEVELKGKRGLLPSYDVTVVHHGRSVIFDEAGQRHVYSHVPIAMPFIRVAGVTTTKGKIASADYVGVSPYGPWTIQVNQPTSDTTTAVTEINLVMRGYGRARLTRVAIEEVSAEPVAVARADSPARARRRLLGLSPLGAAT